MEAIGDRRAGQDGYHCTELGMHLCGELWGETEKCIELKHTVEGFGARWKHYLSLLIIATIYWAFKYQALCVVCCRHFRWKTSLFR